MAKRFFLLIAMVLLCGTCVFAEVDTFYMYMTQNTATTAQKTDAYGYNDLPHLFVHIPNLNILTDKTNTFWFLSDFSSFDELFEIAQEDTTGGVRNLWLTPANWFSGNIRQAGDWGVQAKFFSAYPSGAPKLEGAGCTRFTINAVPEPISSALFLLGGVGLIGRRLTRRNTKV